ncbi:MAG: serine/threonine protein kinase, partial [Labilithrix sp.]|nr:serine/threonine protein kinase [Labilithrix sp.]
TQPSSISVASGTQSRAHDDAPGGHRTAVAALVGVMLGATVLATALVYRHTQQNKAKAATSATVETSDAPPGSHGVALVTPPTNGTTTSTPTVDAVDSGVAADTTPVNNGSGTPTGAGATQAQPVAATPPKLPPKTGPRTQPPAPIKPPAAETKLPPSSGADCTTPVWFDAQGVKHYKPQCLDK